MLEENLGGTDWWYPFRILIMRTGWHDDNWRKWMDGRFFCRLATSPLRSTERFQQREETFQQPFLVAGLLVSVKGGRGIRAGRNSFWRFRFGLSEVLTCFNLGFPRKDRFARQKSWRWNRILWVYRYFSFGGWAINRSQLRYNLEWVSLTWNPSAGALNTILAPVIGARVDQGVFFLSHPFVWHPLNDVWKCLFGKGFQLLLSF